MNIYVVCTPLDVRELEKYLYDTASLVMLPQECLRVLQPVNEAPYVVSTCPDPDNERWNIVPMGYEVIDFNDVDLNECPACGHKLLPQEEWINGYCNRCGFTWTPEKMWFEEYVKDE